MLRKIRILLSLLMLLGITLLFLDFTGAAHAWLGWMAKVQFLPAVLALNLGVVLALVVVTLLVGRVYCSVVCPLGVMQDVFAWLGKKLRPRSRRRAPYAYSPALTWLRYAVLVLFVVALVAGLGSVAALVAPYSAYGRIAANLLQPLWLWGNNALAAVAEHYGSYAFYEREVWIRGLPTLVVAVATLVVVAVLAVRGGRTWCNTVCPVGTVLGQLARVSLFKVRIDETKCVGCRQCEHACKASCIDLKTLRIDHSRCVDCFDCLDVCRKDAIGLRTRTKAHGAQADASAGGQAAAGPSRRAFLVATAGVAATAALEAQEKTVDGGLAAITDKKAPRRATPITPPGSVSARHMAQHCTACQLCVAECPNHVLRPSAEWSTMMQPVMSYERGHCRPECNRCGQVCPTGAIRPLAVEVKASTKVGRAVWIADNCVPLTDGVSCGNCARHCPSGAITMVPSDKDDPKSLKIPAVNEERCIGCGACEHLCPARPFSAIYVEGVEVQREI